MLSAKFIRPLARTGGVLFIAILTACGGSSGGGGGMPLPLGAFTKTVMLEGSGTGPNNGLFSDTTGAMAPAQFLYRAEDVNGAGMIASLTFQHHVDALAAADCPDITVKMGHVPTSVTDLVADQGTNTGNVLGTLQTVIDGPVTAPAGTAGAFFEVPLDTPFEYNGADHLFVEYARGAACTDQVPIRQAEGLGYDAGSFASLARQILYHTRFNFEGGDNRVTVADQTADNSNTIAPGATGRAQMLIRNVDIDGEGPITGIRFDANTVTAESNVTVTVRMVHIATTTSNLGGDFAANFGGVTPTTVAENVQAFIPADAGTFWLPLTESFDYNGSDHILVDVMMESDNAFSVDYRNVPNSRIVSNGTVAAETGTVRPRAFQPTFRFNGGKIQAMDNTDNGSSQVFGGITISGGQIQSLYMSTSLGTAGTVTSISVRLNADSVATSLTNYKLYMGHTDKTTFTTADTYASNMDEALLVFDGTLDVASGLKEGDWLTIPLQKPFSYDATRNLSILFTTDAGSVGDNDVSMSAGARFPNHSVGRNNNAVDPDGNPNWDFDGYVNIQLELR